MSLASETGSRADPPIARRMARGARRSLLSRVLDFVLPPLCIHCRQPIAEHGRLCPDCWRRIDFITPPLCDVTGLPLPYDAGGGQQLSALAVSRSFAFERARAVARFDGVMRTLVHGLKYGDRREGLALYGRWLALAGRDLLADAELIVPVPLYRTRLWRRRFNQSALLGFELARLTGLPISVLALKRRRATRSQVGLSERQRRQNVAGAFKVIERRRHLIENRCILLIDDVLTTGATIEACATALKKAGARRVDVLVLARVGADGLDIH